MYGAECSLRIIRSDTCLHLLSLWWPYVVYLHTYVHDYMYVCRHYRHLWHCGKSGRVMWTRTGSWMDVKECSIGYLQATKGAVLLHFWNNNSYRGHWHHVRCRELFLLKLGYRDADLGWIALPMQGDLHLSDRYDLHAMVWLQYRQPPLWFPVYYSAICWLAQLVCISTWIRNHNINLVPLCTSCNGPGYVCNVHSCMLVVP